MIKSDSDSSAVELKQGLTATTVGLVLNIFLIGAKLVGGLVGHSQGLLADAVHSASDLFTDVVVLFGLKWGRKKADAQHPYGHGRIETLASLVVGITLLGAGLSIAYDALVSVYEHQPHLPTNLALAVTIVSILSKEAMYWYTLVVGRRIRSEALIGNAWHHRSDAMSSVAVLAGIVAVRVNPEWFLADSIAALLVSLFLFRICTSIVWKALKELADTAPDEATIESIHALAVSVDSVLQVHGLKARYSGPDLLVEMHVVIDGDVSVSRGHEIAHSVRRAVRGQMTTVGDVLIHIEPESVLASRADSDSQ
ncbi:MAG: cation diffusion facilitator family transporter [candidate division Zixibacteria bacterium]